MGLFKNKEKEKAKNFNETRSLNGVKFDDDNKEILISRIGKPIFLKYDEVIEVRISQTLKDISKEKGGISKAVGLSMVLGGVGALIGALSSKVTTTRFLTEMDVVIRLSNEKMPVFNIPIFRGKVKFKSKGYDLVLEKTKKIAMAIDEIKYDDYDCIYENLKDEI